MMIFYMYITQLLKNYLVEYLAESVMMSLTKGQMAEENLSLTKGQIAPSLALVAILVAH